MHGYDWTILWQQSTDEKDITEITLYSGREVRNADRFWSYKYVVEYVWID